WAADEFDAGRTGKYTQRVGHRTIYLQLIREIDLGIRLLRRAAVSKNPKIASFFRRHARHISVQLRRLLPKLRLSEEQLAEIEKQLRVLDRQLKSAGKTKTSA